MAWAAVHPTGVPAVNRTNGSDTIAQIVANAEADGIDFSRFDWTAAALSEVASISQNPLLVPDFSNATKIDTHTHAIPNFFRALINRYQPANRVPAWSLQDHLAYNSANGIARSVVSVSMPGNIFYDNAAANAAVYRLTNEYMAALKTTYPDRFSFVANVPLPYIKESIVEAKYALDNLGADGMGVLSSHEGQYHGSEAWTPFYDYLNTKKVGIFYDPTTPLRKVNDSFVPTYPEYGFSFAPFDFLFETARNIMNMTAAHVMTDHTDMRFLFAHCGGAFASIADRYFSSPIYGPDETWDDYAAAFQTRTYWDTAGPMFPHAVQGLFAYDIPKSHLLYGTDFPYSAQFQGVPGELLNALIEGADFLSEDEKTDIFERNAYEFLAIRA